MVVDNVFEKEYTSSMTTIRTQLEALLLTDLEVFKVTRNGSGELSKLEWAFDAKTNTQVLNLPVENVAAIISVKQP